jgi:hypothetical protein
MEGQREKSSSRRRQRRKAKAPRVKAPIEPVLIVARRPDSPLLKNGFHNAAASAQPKNGGHSVKNGHSLGMVDTLMSDQAANGHSPTAHHFANGNGHLNGYSASHAVPGAAIDGQLARSAFSDSENYGEADAKESSDKTGPDAPRGDVTRRRAVRIVKVAPEGGLLGTNNREQQLLDRLVRSQGRGAISRAADDLWESKFVAPRQQEIQIQLLEHENEQRARDAVFVMAELLQREAPIKRPVLDQRLRRLEQSAEDPITRDAAGALRRSMRVHHGV